ncbi:class I SAM-dependent methyltransferase [Variovorax sp. OV329]|uniref:class I SAM-dependent methyltransferase n=1 Tax=Variovorax sp. OV329 TaxID=1882825 RepID=UPI0008F3DD9F|nr:class I SAM-dependent methyltransferase [Variovorax sp. OV329]SFN07108.1 Precorrin-6B methylase 2 [Variovorax sp. OV329]
MSKWILQPHHIDNARLYADRQDMIPHLGIERGGTIAEIGVAHGDFSEFLMHQLMPEKFYAVDLFHMHEFPQHWGIPTEQLLKGMTHEQFYRHRFQARNILVEAGWSHEALPRLPDDAFDFIYVDAGHDYEAVRKDAEVANRKLKANGVIVFNDYTCYDHLANVPYGVVDAVNEMVCAGGWKVIGFALQDSMFCDIALRRA